MVWFLRLLHDGWFFFSFSAVFGLVWVNVIKLIKLAAECGFACCVYAAKLVLSFFSRGRNSTFWLGTVFFYDLYTRKLLQLQRLLVLDRGCRNFLHPLL